MFLKLSFQSLHSASETSRLRLAMANGNVMTIPLNDGDGAENVKSVGINITDELTRTGVWRSLAGGNQSKSMKNSQKTWNQMNVDKEKNQNDENGIELTFVKSNLN